MQAAAIEAAPVELTVLMPCLDEARTVGACVAKARETCRANDIAAEILVADNGSTDGSQRLAGESGARVIHVPSRGYGSALRAGIDAARGRYVVIADADDSYDFGDIPAFLAQLRAGAHLVMGSRFRGTIHPGAMPLLHRFLGNPVLTWILNLFFGAGISDAHCGMRGFSRDAIRGLSLRSSGMEFASDAGPTCAPGATGGAIFASCCCSAPCGCFSCRARSSRPPGSSSPPPWPSRG